MGTRAVIWLLAVFAVGLIVVPVIGMFGMMSMHWMTSGGGMMVGMSAAGIVWMLAAIVIVAALIVLLVRSAVGTR